MASTVLQQYVFRPITDQTFSSIRTSLNSFMRAMYQAGMFGGSSEGRSYFVKCDNENNTTYTKSLHQIICDIGINPPGMAEFIIVRIGTWDGGTSIAEELARRGGI
jgi:phage tail sheath protein FI